MELLDNAGHLLDWRTYQVPVTGGQFPSLLAETPGVGQCTLTSRADPGRSK